MRWKFVCGPVLFVIAACSVEKNTGQKTDAGQVTPIVCQGNFDIYPGVMDLIQFDPEEKLPEQAYRDALKNSLSSIPSLWQKRFTQVNGTIKVTKTPNAYCQDDSEQMSLSNTIAENLGGGMRSGSMTPASCWKVNTDKTLTLAVGAEEDGELSLRAATTDFVRSFVEIYQEYLLRYDPSQDEESDGPYLKDDVDQTMFDLFLAHGEDIKGTNVSELFHDTIFNFICSPESREFLLKSDGDIEAILDPVRRDFVAEESLPDLNLALSLVGPAPKPVRVSPNLKKTVGDGDSVTPPNLRLPSPRKNSALTPGDPQEEAAKVPTPVRRYLSASDAAPDGINGKGQYAPARLAGGLSRIPKTLGQYYTGQPRMLGKSQAGKADSEQAVNLEKPVIIMVHGTFSGHVPVKKDGWANPDGKNADKLREKFGGEVLSFQWSGRNRQSSRSEAAQALQGEIKKLKAAGHTDIRIISHSHGGNVAVEALNRAKAEDKSFSIHEFHAIARPVRDSYHLTDKIARVTHYSGGKDRVVPLAGGRDFFAKNSDRSAHRLYRIDGAGHSEAIGPAIDIITGKPVDNVKVGNNNRNR